MLWLALLSVITEISYKKPQKLTVEVGHGRELTAEGRRLNRKVKHDHFYLCFFTYHQAN